MINNRWANYTNQSLAVIYRSASNWSIMFSYDGWNTLNYSLNEFRKPGKKTYFHCPQESISNNNNIDETIAATFFYRFFGTAAAGVWSYWIFYFATGIGLLLIRCNKKNELKKKQFDINDKKLNENSSLFSNITREYKVPLPFAIIFILAGLFILVFSFVVNVECPKDKPNCDLEKKRLNN
ncbi:amino acid/polyamine transporter I [Rhizophagus irregularis DAOM 181602=DAOM 197198]|nr:amino acid/polyamine transporter I [Rhizophagus irregularis DAOM 181602=DAOM 197198]